MSRKIGWADGQTGHFRSFSHGFFRVAVEEILQVHSGEQPQPGRKRAETRAGESQFGWGAPARWERWEELEGLAGEIPDFWIVYSGKSREKWDDLESTKNHQHTSVVFWVTQPKIATWGSSSRQHIPTNRVCNPMVMI